MKQIIITAHWVDQPDMSFITHCQVGIDYNENDDDDEIFYYFEEGEEILGEHGDFTVVAWEVVV